MSRPMSNQNIIPYFSVHVDRPYVAVWFKKQHDRFMGFKSQEPRWRGRVGWFGLSGSFVCYQQSTTRPYTCISKNEKETCMGVRGEGSLTMESFKVMHP